MSSDRPPLVVTISATFGAGGSEVGPRVADALGLPFVDRAIPAEVAERLQMPMPDAESRDDAAPYGLPWLLRGLAAVSPVSGVDFGADFADRSFADATEAVICRHADGDGGVILGRAAAVVLGDRPGTVHVRLDGPLERRVEQAMRHGGLDRETAERRIRDNDGAREAYVREFYGADARDPALYHLVLDSTALPLDACVDLIVTAARAKTEARTAGRL
jgi:cytidylate kinase